MLQYCRDGTIPLSLECQSVRTAGFQVVSDILVCLDGAVPDHFVCASGDQYVKHLSKERPGLEVMTDLLRQFAMFLKLQLIIENSLDCFLSRF
mgnify:CR=1 FL=1